MRIISKFHDYYDNAQGYGQDQRLIYRRETKIRDFTRWDLERQIPAILSHRPLWYRFTPRLAVLGFCGRIYPMWLDGAQPLTVELLSADNSPELRLQDKRAMEEFSAGETHGNKRSLAFKRVLEHLERLRGERLRSSALNEDVFRELDCPLFLAVEHPFDYWNFKGGCHGVRVFTNPRLATLGFMRTFDSFSAFQEIATFLGMSLAPEDRAPRTVGDDKVIAESKGFDEQSFRTQAPGQKKVNRQVNKRRKRGEL